MNYIKELYTKKPELLVEFAKKTFKTRYDNHVRVAHAVNKNNLGDRVLFIMYSSEYNNLEHELLEFKDFSINWKDEDLKYNDKRLIRYFKFMTKIYGLEFLREFREYRKNQRNAWLDEFDAETTYMEKEILAVVDKSKNKKAKEVEETNNF